MFGIWGLASKQKLYRLVIIIRIYLILRIGTIILVKENTYMPIVVQFIVENAIGFVRYQVTSTETGK